MEEQKGKRFHLIPGFHAVREVIREGHPAVHELWISERKDPSKVKEIIDMAEDKGIPVSFKKTGILDNLLPGTTHQGIVALAGEFTYIDLESLIHKSVKSQGKGLIIATDHITDEGNLGSIIRSSLFFGVHGLIIPKDRSAQVTHNVIKRSSGAHAYLPVSRVVNMGRALDILNKNGFWIVGAAEESTESVYQFDWDRDLVLVLGNENKGLSPAIRKRCHALLKIPSSIGFTSLNVSVACGVILSEITRRKKIS